MSYLITNKIKEQLDLLNKFEQYKEDLNHKLQYDIISGDGATQELLMISKKEKELKKALISQVHVTSDGKERKIEYKENKGLWKTLLPGKVPITAKTEDALVDKLMVFYGLSMEKTTIQDVFESALKLKAVTENNKAKTIERIRDDFHTYISSDFQKKDIRKIDKYYLREHTQTMVNTLHPKRKAFFAYKHVLNIIFEYALDKDIIQNNPVLGIKNAVYYKSCDNATSSCEEKIFSEDEIEQIKEKIESRKSWKTYKGYFASGYAILFAIETGMRVAEICGLKWVDISDKFIHIHRQLLSEYDASEKCDKYYLVDYTKNEKGVSQGGRYFPISPNIMAILDELKSVQTELGITSEYVFCNRNGNWTTTEAYSNVLYRLCKSLGFGITNNHAFRMSLNSNVFIRKYNFDVATRAKLLGHSVEVNLRYYTFEARDAEEMAYTTMNRDDSIYLVSPTLTQV